MTEGLTEYLPPINAPGAAKYVGDVAKNYDAKRESSPKWVIEQRIITDMLSDLLEGTTVFDCPVGTGRFLQFYVDKGFKITGMDISGDMLKQAASRRLNMPKGGRPDGELRAGDVRNTGLPDKSFDVSVNCRITRWLSREDCVKMYREMQRIVKHRIIFTARVRNHTHARGYELIEEALDGWQIYDDKPGVDMDYRIIQLRPVA